MSRGSSFRLLAVIVGALLVTALVVVGTPAALRLWPRHAPSGQPPLDAMADGDASDFVRAFNAASAQVRVVALLSPT